MRSVQLITGVDLEVCATRDQFGRIKVSLHRLHQDGPETKLEFFVTDDTAPKVVAALSNEILGVIKQN